MGTFFSGGQAGGNLPGGPSRARTCQGRGDSAGCFATVARASEDEWLDAEAAARYLLLTSNQIYGYAFGLWIAAAAIAALTGRRAVRSSRLWPVRSPAVADGLDLVMRGRFPDPGR